MAIKKKTETPAPDTETKTTATKKKVVKKTVAKKEEASVPPPTPAPVAVAPAEEPAEDNSLLEMSSMYFATLQSLAQQINKAKSDYRVLEKKWIREIKQSQKVAKKKRKNGNRAPSGFVKPTRISDELASFLGVEKGVEMARTDVTKEITAYIRAHSLQDKDNGRQINPDAKLKGLLQIGGDDVLTYFNLQKYMSPHFAKSVKAVAAAAAAAAGDA
jgi:upstream activation factor subunit UAF30